ncbi:hypothetical protein Tco_0044640 [Tanacetum coccineum]
MMILIHSFFLLSTGGCWPNNALFMFFVVVLATGSGVSEDCPSVVPGVVLINADQLFIPVGISSIWDGPAICSGLYRMSSKYKSTLPFTHEGL